MRAATVVLPALLLALVTGCAGSGGGGPETAITRPLLLETIKLVMERGANGNAPARVDLVRTEDPGLIDQLLAIEAGAWFGGKGDVFAGAHPEAIFNRWEPVPGTVIGPEDVKVSTYVGGVLFCGTEGAQAPITVERDGDVTVVIDDDGCEVLGGTPSSEPVTQEVSRGFKKFWEGLLDLLLWPFQD